MSCTPLRAGGHVPVQIFIIGKSQYMGIASISYKLWEQRRRRSILYWNDKFIYLLSVSRLAGDAHMPLGILRWVIIFLGCMQRGIP